MWCLFRGQALPVFCQESYMETADVRGYPLIPSIHVGMRFVRTFLNDYWQRVRRQSAREVVRHPAIPDRVLMLPPSPVLSHLF